MATIVGSQVLGGALMVPPGGGLLSSALVLIREITVCGVIPGVNLATAVNKGATTYVVGINLTTGANILANGTLYEANTTNNKKAKWIVADALNLQPQAVQTLVAGGMTDITYNCHGYSFAHGAAVTMPDGKEGPVIIQDDESVQSILDSAYEKETDHKKINQRFDAGERLIVLYKSNAPLFKHSAVASKIDVAGITDKTVSTNTSYVSSKDGFELLKHNVKMSTLIVKYQSATIEYFFLKCS